MVEGAPVHGSDYGTKYLLTACGYRSGIADLVTLTAKKLTKTCRLNPRVFFDFCVRADPLRVWLSFQHSWRL